MRKVTDVKGLVEDMLSLATDKRYQNILTWYELSLSDHRIENDTMVDLPGHPDLSRNQGRCQGLIEILSVNREAREIYNRMKENKERNER